MEQLVAKTARAPVGWLLAAPVAAMFVGACVREPAPFDDNAGSAANSDAGTTDTDADAEPTMESDASVEPDANSCGWDPTDCFGDPCSAPLACSSANDLVTATLWKAEGPTLELGLSWCGLCDVLCYHHGTIKDLAVEGTSPWATVTLPAYSCPYKAAIELEAGATQGGLRLTASIHGADECHLPLTCPIDKLYELSQGDGGTWVMKEVVD